MPMPVRSTRVMGIVNVTPDSFYDGGKFETPEDAAGHARQLIEDGAQILDIGGESTRPGSAPVDPEQEIARVIPVVELLRDAYVPISVDTYRADTARAAIDAGATMINDISALRWDPDMAGVIAECDCDIVLMHTQGTPQTMQEAPAYADVVDDILAFFDGRVRDALDAGIGLEHIWIDPGFGFGKTPAHNLEILRRLDAFNRFACPVLIGTSNKSTIGAVIDADTDDRFEGTAATVAAAALKGVAAVRVHDVRAMARVVRMATAINQGIDFESSA